MSLPGKADFQSALPKAGLAVYMLGTLVYFAEWLPRLAARLTPFLSFLGIAVLGGSWPYGVVAAVFIFFHTWHGIQNL